MAASTFTKGAIIVTFNWEQGTPEWAREDNTDVYRGTITIFATTLIPLPATEMTKLAGLWREVIFRPIPASSGGGTIVDYNGDQDPAGVLILADGQTLTVILTRFRRTQWRTEVQQADVEFKRSV
jgi:hypothetical protein